MRWVWAWCLGGAVGVAMAAVLVAGLLKAKRERLMGGRKHFVIRVMSGALLLLLCALFVAGVAFPPRTPLGMALLMTAIAVSLLALLSLAIADLRLVWKAGRERRRELLRQLEEEILRGKDEREEV